MTWTTLTDFQFATCDFTCSCHSWVFVVWCPAVYDGNMLVVMLVLHCNKFFSNRFWRLKTTTPSRHRTTAHAIPLSHKAKDHDAIQNNQYSNEGFNVDQGMNPQRDATLNATLLREGTRPLRPASSAEWIDKLSKWKRKMPITKTNHLPFIMSNKYEMKLCAIIFGFDFSKHMDKWFSLGELWLNLHFNDPLINYIFHHVSLWKETINQTTSVMMTTRGRKVWTRMRTSTVWQFQSI